jgi:hypothetical protein
MTPVVDREKTKILWKQYAKPVYHKNKALHMQDNAQFKRKAKETAARRFPSEGPGGDGFSGASFVNWL